MVLPQLIIHKYNKKERFFKEFRAEITINFPIRKFKKTLKEKLIF